MGPGLFQFRGALALVLRELPDCSLEAVSVVLAWGSDAVEPGSGTLSRLQWFCLGGLFLRSLLSASATR